MYEYWVDGKTFKYHCGPIFNMYAAIELAQAAARENDAEGGHPSIASVWCIEDNEYVAMCTAGVVFMPV
jgi:hypothetical protein